MKARDIVKEVGGIAVGAGVGIIVGGACGIAAPVVGLSLVTKGLITVGSVVLGSMVEDKATEYFQDKVDEVCNVLKPQENSDDQE